MLPACGNGSLWRGNWCLSARGPARSFSQSLLHIADLRSVVSPASTNWNLTSRVTTQRIHNSGQIQAESMLCIQTVTAPCLEPLFPLAPGIESSGLFLVACALIYLASSRNLSEWSSSTLSFSLSIVLNSVPLRHTDTGVFYWLCQVLNNDQYFSMKV